jgi:MFS family permease
VTRNLRLFFLFRLLATSYLYGSIFMAFQTARGLDLFEQLGLGAIFSAVVLIVQLPTGVFADRVGRRRSMIAGAWLMVASCLIAARAGGFVSFAIAESLAAVSYAACSGADSAYLYDLLVAHDRGHEYPQREAVASAWHLAGSALALAGGGVLAEIDLELPYLVTAATAAGAAIVAGMLDEKPPALPRTSWWRDMTGALGDVARSPRLAWMVGYSAVVFTLVTATKYAYQPYLHDRGLGTAAIGFVFAGVQVVAAIVAYRTSALRRRFGDDALLWILLAGLAVSFVGLAGTARGPWILSLLVVQAVAIGMYAPLTKPLLNREIADSSRRASVLSVESMARRAAMGVFAALAGLYGESNVMLVCGVAGIAGFAFLAVTRLLPAAADPR